MNERSLPVAKPLPPLHVEPVGDGYCVLAGDQPWRTPAGQDLIVPTRALAEVLMTEIGAARGLGKSGRPRMDDLIYTRLAATAIDRIAPSMAATREAILAFAGTDLVCYRDAAGSPLRARQDSAWQPLLEWLAQTFDARLIVLEGVMPQPQPQMALDSLMITLESYDRFVLAGLGLAVETAGSLVIGLALGSGKIDPAQAWALADLDEAYQNEQWGEDSEALAKRRLRAADIDLAWRFLALLKTPNNDNGTHL
jgi:chaperone required for assembly of F1-ATPase